MAEATHSEGYEKAVKYYPTLWSAKMLVALVKKGKLYEDEYNEITGLVYPNVE